LRQRIASGLVFAFGVLFGDVAGGLRVVVDAGEREHVKGVVELPVAAAVQAVAVGASGGDGNRRAPREASELRVGLEAVDAADRAGQLPNATDHVTHDPHPDLGRGRRAAGGGRP
jgi:hypothetical protein